MQNNNINLISKYSIEELKNGYVYNEQSDDYTCIICNQNYINGYIYQFNESFMDAKKSITEHIKNEHSDMFEYLVSLDKEYNDLTKQQQKMLLLFASNLTDKQISEKIGNVTTANVRNFRYLFKKREQQAKIFLAIMELLNNKSKINEKYKNNEKNLTTKYFDGDKLKKIPKNKNDRDEVLNTIAKNFDPDKIYSEKEVNEILKNIFDDYALLRRELVVYEAILREDDGSMYRFNKKTSEKERRKMLVEEYNNIKKRAGIFQIKNKVNGKIFISSTQDLDVKSKTAFLELISGTNPFHTLQKDFNEYGENNFTFEILEEIDSDKIDSKDINQKLKDLKKQWLIKLKPYGENGYNALKEPKNL